MTAVSTSALVAFCDDLLSAPDFEDYGPNGLQVPGPPETAHVVTGVSAVAALFEAAADAGADLVLVHHGLFWRGDPLGLDAVAAARLRLLFRHDLALAAYHLPLDAHPAIGNNALFAAALGADATEPAFPHGGRPLGLVATFAGDGLPLDELVARTAGACDGRVPLVLPGGPARVRRLGVVTGEPAERATALARELGVTFLAAGHHATETFGVRALGDALAAEFGITHTWVDVPNPV
jgi:putative NIF3 family GTP cyclohydrolase 1 type 2